MGINNRYALSLDQLSEQLAALEQSPPERVLDMAVQLVDVAIAQAEKAESAGDHRQAAELYRLTARAYQQAARVLPPDLRESMLSPARYWDERAELALKRVEEAAPPPAPPHPPHRQETTIRTPKPMSISALSALTDSETKTSIVRGGTERRQRPPDTQKQRGEYFERPSKDRSQLEDLDRSTADRSIRKPGQK
jgi:hypothetical protein